jgi:hypothetical protein
MFFTSDLSLDSETYRESRGRGARTASILAENLGPSKNLHGENVDVRVAKGLRLRSIAVE